MQSSSCGLLPPSTYSITDTEQFQLWRGWFCGRCGLVSLKYTLRSSCFIIGGGHVGFPSEKIIKRKNLKLAELKRGPEVTLRGITKLVYILQTGKYMYMYSQKSCQFYLMAITISVICCTVVCTQVSHIYWDD